MDNNERPFVCITCYKENICFFKKDYWGKSYYNV